MKKRKVINRNQLPVAFPTMQTLCAFMALSYFQAPQWLWVVMGALYFIVWIAIIIRMCSEKQVDIFKEQE
jgi:hypothetical protein